jgi:hypothetical protein
VTCPLRACFVASRLLDGRRQAPRRRGRNADVAGMIRPEKLVEIQIGLALQMYFGGRAHGAFAPRLH